MGRKKEEPKEDNIPTQESTVTMVVEPVKKEPKKRGRKPKENVEVVEKKNKKRGRKPKEKFNFSTSGLDFNSTIDNENESIIVRLPISSLDLNSEIDYSINNLLMYNPNVYNPNPYDPNDPDIINIKTQNQVFENEKNQNENQTENQTENQNENQKSDLSTSNETINLKNKKVKTYDITTSIDINNYQDLSLEEDNFSLLRKNIENHNILKENNLNKNVLSNILGSKSTRQIDILLQNKYKNEKKLELLVELSNNKNEWINKTDTSCFWCCHQFETIPWGIPLRYVDNKFQCFGIFCSPNCATSYIFYEMKDDYNIWELNSLINLLYYKIHGEYRQILPAPSKMCLTKFGGRMPIEEYRENHLDKYSIYPVKFPPIISVIPVMDEINLKKIQTSSGFIPIDKTRISNANNELRLKRRNPLNNRTTLDSLLVN